jgi:hypothetical protein
MPKENQGSSASEREISVDMNAADPSKAVTRRKPADIGQGVRDDADGDRPRTKAEKELFKRMGRLERNLEKQFEQRQAARDAEHQRQISELQAKLDRVQVDRGGGDDAADRAHETAINVLKDKLAAAYEKGDSKESAELQAQISRLDAQFWAKKAAAAGQTTRETAAAGDGGQQRQQQGTQQQQNKGPTVAGSRFIRANEEWWDDPEFEVEKAAANTIYVNLVNKEGFDPKDDETFKEVAKQLKAKFPKLEVRAGRKGGDPEDDDDPDDDVRRGEGEGDGETRQQRRAAAANLADRGAASARDRSRTSRTLTKQEIETMKACRLDPDNDKDVVQFMKEAAALEAAS